MSAKEHSSSLIIDTNALLFQTAFWIDVRIKTKSYRLKDSRIGKSHTIISKYEKKHITPTIQSEFYEGTNIKAHFRQKLLKMLGIRSRMALNQLLVKPLEKLRTRIITIPVTCLQSELDAVTMFYTDTISTLTHDDEKSWKTGYGTDKPFMPEDNDRKILAECVKIHTSENIALLSNDRAFVFPKFKEQIESKFGILIECL